MTKQTVLTLFNKFCWRIFKHQIKYSKLDCENQQAALNLAYGRRQTQMSCIVGSYIFSVRTLRNKH